MHDHLPAVRVLILLMPAPKAARKTLMHKILKEAFSARNNRRSETPVHRIPSSFGAAMARLRPAKAMDRPRPAKAMDQQGGEIDPARSRSCHSGQRGTITEPWHRP
jgi:hypothetical protein